MKMTMYAKLLSAFAVFACAFVPGRAAAETTLCTEITSLPASISTQGVYCLKKHMPISLASGAGITVLVNNVTIDCNLFKIGNLAAGPATEAIGILAENRVNVRIRDCGIRGFRRGLSLTNGDYRVTNNVVDYNTQIGIYVSGAGSAVRNNEVVDTGETTIDGVNNFYGILVEDNVDVADNLISGVTATSGSGGNAYGIRANDSNAATISGNRIKELSAAPGGARRGIWIESGAKNAVLDNTIVLHSALALTDTGVRCGSGILILNGVASGNVIMGAGLLGNTLGIVNCTPILAGNYIDLL